MRHGPRPHPDGTTTFRVWAPRAEEVTLVVDDRRVAMAPAGGGWQLCTTSAGHGDRYGFSLDGEPVRPDPAARWQPEGVHAPSAVVDPRTFAWSAGEAGWRARPLRGAVLYELHVGTFTPEGTLHAAAARLPEVADLGITHVELMPVNAFDGAHGWGYDGVAWYAVHEPYGGPAGLVAFVDAAHRLGLGVVLDVVYNHLGPSGNYLDEFGPYLTDRYATPWGGALNVDGAGSDPVRAFVVGNALAWLEDYHLDGLRFDAVHAIIDSSAQPLLADVSAAVEASAARQGRPLLLVAESDRSDPHLVRDREHGGAGFHAQWADDLHHAVHTALTGERDGYYADYRGLADVAACYRRGFALDGRYSAFRDRTVGAPQPWPSGHHLVTFLQNHDQIGNRALGERLEELVGPARTRVGAVLVLAAPHTPLLFMGEEHAETAPFRYFTDHPDPALAAAVRAGRQREFEGFAGFTGTVPDPQAPETFAASRLDWQRPAAPEGAARRRLYRALLALRRSEPALANGRRDLVEVLGVDAETLALVRGDPDGSAVLIAANLAAEPRSVALQQPAFLGAGLQPLLCSQAAEYAGSGESATAAIEGGVLHLQLPAESAALWRALTPA